MSSPFDSYPTGRNPVLTDDDFIYERTAIDQQPDGGYAYPFSPRHALTQLVADFYLSYTDDLAAFQLPLRVVWLHGFGSLAGTEPAGLPAPAHVRDLLIADALGNVVFDSTTATVFSSYSWGSYEITAWETTGAIARIVSYPGLAGDFSIDLAYSDAWLSARTYERLPLRVRSITVGEVKLSGDIVIAPGYNMALTGDSPAPQDGSRVQSTITIAGTLGAGAGLAPGCTETTVKITSINQISADASGNFSIQADGCFRVEQNLSFSGGTGSFTTDATRATLQVFSDCQPCCTCTDYADTYKGLDTAWNNWLIVAQQAELIRDLYAANKARWETQAACRDASWLQFVMMQEPGCKTFLGAMFCNRSACCLFGVRIRFTVTRYTEGVLDPDLDTLSVPAAFISGNETNGDMPYAPQISYGGGGAVVECYFEQVDPQSSVIARLKACVNCDSTQTLAATATVHATGIASGCALDTITVPDSLQAIWTAAHVDAVSTLDSVAAMAPLSPAPADPVCNC